MRSGQGRNRAAWVVVAAATVMLPRGAAAQDIPQRVLIEQALDENSRIDLEDVTMAEAIRRVAEQTGVELRAAARTLALLPYGEQTRVSATIHNIPLRRGLEELLRPLGLRYEVAERWVDVRPTEPLLRLARPATWSELELLGRLHRDRWSEASARALPLRFVGEPAVHDDSLDKLLGMARRESQGTLAELLETACDALGWSWWPEGEQVMVAERARGERRLLSRRISLARREWSAEELLAELAEATGLRLRIEPGALAAVPHDARERLAVLAENVPVEQVLEMVGGATGLGYELSDGVLRIRRAAGGPGAVARRDDPVVGKVIVPGAGGGYHFEFVLRESDLPEELNALRRERIRGAVEAMERDFGQ